MKIVTVVLILLSAGAVLALIRMIFSRESSTKAIVLDVLTTLVTAVIVLLALLFHSAFLLDIALVYAILSFAAVLVVARYLERGI